MTKCYLSKQKWLIDAFKEKLKKQEQPLDHIPKEPQLLARIDKRLNEKIKKRVELIKKFRSTYSKKMDGGSYL